MEDDLLVTNKYISSESSNKNINKEHFKKFIDARNNINNVYTGKYINELTSNNNLLEEDTILLGSLNNSIYGSGSGVSGNSINTQNMRFKRTKISIDSKNREKITKINSNLIKLGTKNYNWTFKSAYQSRVIRVYAPGHGFKESDIGNSEIYFSNLEKSEIYDEICIKREYLEHNSITNSPRFSIKSIFYAEPREEYYDVSTDTYESDYFEIELDNKIDIKFVKESTFGGSNVDIYRIISYEQGYNDPSHYKINLGKRFSNVYMVRLLSIEIPNTTYTINSIKKTSNIGSLQLNTKINSKIKWITENNNFNTFNLSLYSDNVFLNTVNINKYSNLYNNNFKSNNQIIYSNKMLNKIAEHDDRILRNDFFMITNQINSELDFYSPKIFHVSNNPDEGSIAYSELLDNSAKYWLPNAYHNYGKTLIYDLNNSIRMTNNDYDNSTLYNTNFKNKNLFYYNYYDKLVRSSNLKINFNDSNTYKSIFLQYNYNNNTYLNNTLGIPHYQGYFLFENNLSNNSENSTILSNEFVETIDENNSKYIFPITNSKTEKFMAPIIVPDTIEDDSNIKLITQKRYPIYEINLNDGKYSKNEFISVLQKSLSETKKQIITGYEKFFKKKNVDIKKNYNYDNQDTISFKVNINKNLNLIDIRQYTKIKSFEFSKISNPNIIYYNEGLPYINLKIYGHQLKTGDKISIENSPSFENIDSEQINKEHMVYVMPSYKIYMRPIFPLPDLTYLDQKEYFNTNLGESIKISNNNLAEKYKRDLKKFTIPNDDSINDSYDYDGIGNSNNKFGRSKHSEKERYPIKKNDSSREYGNLDNNDDYPFGIYYDKTTYNNNIDFEEPYPKSSMNMDDETLIYKFNNAENNVIKTKANTLRSKTNYYGSKLINSVNNGEFYPEKFNQFNKNSINTKGIKISFLENETFIKLSDINSINSNTSIGRIGTIHNDGRPNENGNYSLSFDLLTDVRFTQFKIGDFILGLESNCIAVIVPEKWNYDGIPHKEVFNYGFGTYLLEKYKKHSIFSKILDSSDKYKFAKSFNSWKSELVENGSQNVYIKLNNTVSNTNLEGLETKKLIIYKPVKYKFLFDVDTSPINRLNIPIEQEFSYSQNNLVEFDNVNIYKSYLLGLYNNIQSNYLILETLESFNIEKNDRIYIKNHKLFNKYRNNKKNKILNIKNLEPFRNYLQFIENQYEKLDLNDFKLEKNKQIYFKNINHIYDYENDEYLLHLGNGNNLLTAYYLEEKTDGDVFHVFSKFSSQNNSYNFGLRDRIINWFFENKFLWNGNNLEKILEFDEQFANFKIDNNSRIIKLIVSPLDSYGKNFNEQFVFKNTNSNDKLTGMDYVIEPPYEREDNNGNIDSIKRNSENILPFLKGMGVYCYLNPLEPKLIGYVLDTTINSIDDYINNYQVNEYSDNYTVAAIKVINKGSGYIGSNPPTITINHPNGQIFEKNPKFKKAKAKAIIENGEIVDIVLLDGGFAYSSNNFDLTIDDNNGSGGKATVYTTRLAPTYSIFVLVNEDSEIYNEISMKNTQEDNSLVKKIARGTDIFFNFNKPIFDKFDSEPINNGSDYSYVLSGNSSSAVDGYYKNWFIEIVEGPGKGFRAVITNYTASTRQIKIIPDDMHEFINIETTQYKIHINSSASQYVDFSNYGNYLWNDRRAAATIYQGSLIDNDKDKVYLVSGHLEYFYKSYLQNKCIMHYHQMFSKEELEFFNNHQIILENKEFIIDSDVNTNNFNFTENISTKYKSYINRENLLNPEIISYHSFDIGEKVYIFEHEKSISKYNNMTISKPELVSEIIEDRKSSKYNKIYQTENSGIKNQCVSILCNLWNGLENNSQFLETYKPGKCALLDIDFDEKIENGFMNKGYARVQGYRVPICGSNSNYYNKNIEYDVLFENEAKIKNSTNDDVNLRGTKKIYLFNSNDCSNDLRNMFKKNDIIFIGTSIIGNDELYPNELENKSYGNNQELNVIENTTLQSTYLELELKSPLLNNHFENEVVISKYKYGETFIETNDNSFNRFFSNGTFTSNSITITNKNLSTGDYVQYNNQGNISITIDNILAKNNSFYFVTVINNTIKLSKTLYDLNKNIYLSISGNTNEGEMHHFVKSKFNKKLFDIKVVNGNKITINGHNFENGDLVIFNNDTINSTSFTNLYIGHKYYILKINDNVIKLLDTWSESNNNANIVDLNHSSNDTYTYSITLFYKNQIKVYKNINGINYSDELDIGTIIYLDWANKRYVKKDYTKPFNIIKNDDYTSLSDNDKLLYKYKFTQQMNRIINIDKSNSEYILLTLENTPLIYYPSNTPFIILKKNNIKTATVEECNKNTISSFDDDLLYKKSLKNTYLSTQPFTINNKWYTKIFYQGHHSLNANTKNSFFNDNYKNGWKIGNKIFNTLTSKKLYIYGMKGIEIPFMPVPSNQVNIIIDNHLSNSSSIKSTDDKYRNVIDINIPYNGVNIIKPVPDNNYIIKPIIKEDFFEYSEKDFNNITIPGYFKNSFEYLQEYSNSLENIIDKYNNFTNDKFWIDNNDSFNEINSYDYNYIVIEGIYLGYGGYITETTDENDNIVNSVDGYKVLETFKNTTNNGFNIVIDLEEREMNLNLTKDDFFDKQFNYSSSLTNTIPAGLINKINQFNLLNTNIFKKTINIGKLGSLCKKKINAPLNLEGENYIYLCIPQFSHLLNTSKPIINSAFAKILLPGETNKTIFNSHIGGSVVFYNGEITELSDIEVAFMTNNKNLFDFNGLDHSFTLEIFELVNT